MIRIEYDADAPPSRPTGPHGSPGNPHTVASPTSLVCLGCGANLAALWLDRMVASAKRVEEQGKEGDACITG